MHRGYWWESQKERDHQEYQDVGGWIVRIKMDLREIGWGLWTGLNWLRMEIIGRLL
jgi:hypothetical protein